MIWISEQEYLLFIEFCKLLEEEDYLMIWKYD